MRNLIAFVAVGVGLWLISQRVDELRLQAKDLRAEVDKSRALAGEWEVKYLKAASKLDLCQAGKAPRPPRPSKAIRSRRDRVVDAGDWDDFRENHLGWQRPDPRKVAPARFEPALRDTRGETLPPSI